MPYTTEQQADLREVLTELLGYLQPHNPCLKKAQVLIAEDRGCIRVPIPEAKGDSEQRADAIAKSVNEIKQVFGAFYAEEAHGAPFIIGLDHNTEFVRATMKIIPNDPIGALKHIRRVKARRPILTPSAGMRYNLA